MLELLHVVLFRMPRVQVHRISDESVSSYELINIICAAFFQSLHAISDLGLLIVKKLVSDETEISQTQVVPLPSQLYTTPEKSEQENGVVSNFVTLLKVDY